MMYLKTILVRISSKMLLLSILGSRLRWLCLRRLWRIWFRFCYWLNLEMRLLCGGTLILCRGRVAELHWFVGFRLGKYLRNRVFSHYSRSRKELENNHSMLHTLILLSYISRMQLSLAKFIHYKLYHRFANMLKNKK